MDKKTLLDKVSHTACGTAVGRVYASIQKDALIFDPYAMLLLGKEGFDIFHQENVRMVQNQNLFLVL